MSLVVFILSADHSGSTWLAYVLGSHSRATFLGEYNRFFNSPHDKESVCSFCKSKFQECAFLRDVLSVNKGDAFLFAQSQFCTPILIDESKRIDWCDQFVSDIRLNYKFIHLIRNPCGWYASKRRRISYNILEIEKKQHGVDVMKSILQSWVDENWQIKKYLDNKSLRYQVVFYDDLAAYPHENFPPLCKFIGMEFEPDALNYWDYEHHGPARNSASFNLLKEKAITTDEAYYKRNAYKQFIDLRWMNELTYSDQRAIKSNTSVNEFLTASGIRSNWFEIATR